MLIMQSHTEQGIYLYLTAELINNDIDYPYLVLEVGSQPEIFFHKTAILLLLLTEQTVLDQSVLVGPRHAPRKQ